MTITEFDRATAIEPLGDGAYAARMDADWWVVRGPNGGYVAAVLLRALADAAGDAARAPRSLTVHYAAPPAEGPVRIEARVEQRGRSLSSLSARMTQNGKLVAACARRLLRALVGPPRLRRAPAAGRRRARRGHRAAASGRPVAADRAALGLPRGGRRGAVHRRGGGRHRRLAAAGRAADCRRPRRGSDDGRLVPGRLHPADRARRLPTIDLTIHFRAPLPLPAARADDWLLAVFRSRHAREGFVEEDGEVWSASGELVAQSRQLALMV